MVICTGIFIIKLIPYILKWARQISTYQRSNSGSQLNHSPVALPNKLSAQPRAFVSWEQMPILNKIIRKVLLVRMKKNNLS